MNERLYELRKALNLTTREFSKRLGMSSGSISLLENGKRSITTKFISAVCREFGVNEEWLVNGEGEMFSMAGKEAEIARIANIMLKETEPSLRNEIIKMVANADEKDLEFMVDMAQEMVNLINAMRDAKENPPTE